MVIFFCCMVKITSAQENYVVKSHEIIISGTSNIHDWTANVIDLLCSAKLKDNSFAELEMSINAETLQSSKGSIMDSKMQDALKTEDYPKIYYKSLSNNLISNTDGNMKVSTTGNLTIAGVTKKISFTASCKSDASGNIAVTGSINILMTDYNIEPPTALFGALTTDNKVTVSYNIVFQKSK